jgi:hypothetical protein
MEPVADFGKSLTGGARKKGSKKPGPKPKKSLTSRAKAMVSRVKKSVKKSKK